LKSYQKGYVKSNNFLEFTTIALILRLSLFLSLRFGKPFLT